MANAPSEILEQIFLLLPDTKECISVCKAWHMTASRIFYSKVTLTRNNASQFIAHNHRSGRWVCTLNFAKDTLCVGEFKELVYQVPNVKMMDLSGLEKTVLPQFLQVLVECQELKSIHEIKVNDNLSGKGREQHFLACYKQQKTITHLNLNNFRSRYTMDDISGNCLDFLPQFQQLTQLSIQNDLLHGDRYMSIHTILEACPKLTGFGLFTKRHFPDGSKPALLAMMENDVTVIKKRKLKQMEFQLHDFHEGYMKYLIIYTQLQKLKIHMIDTDVHDWLIDKENMIIPFAHYLSRVDNVEIVAETVTSKRQQRFHLNDERMTRHWRFVNTVIGERMLHCHVYLSMEGGYNDDQKFKLSVASKKIVLEYGLKPEYPSNNLIKLFNTDDDRFMIDSMEVGDATRYRIEDCIELIQCVMKKCPSIKFILLNRSSLCYRLEAIKSVDIYFDRDKLHSGEGRNYSAKSTKETINHVSLKDAILSTALMQVLCSGDIKVLKLIDCTFPAILDLTHIKHLHFLHISSADTETKMVVCNPIGKISICASSPIVVQT